MKGKLSIHWTANDGTQTIALDKDSVSLDDAVMIHGLIKRLLLVEIEGTLSAR